MLALYQNYFDVVPGVKNGKENTQPFKKKRFIFGLFVLLLVDVLWVASSEFTKFLYTEKKLERPFLITYVRCSMLLVYLFVLCFNPPSRDPCRPTQDYTQLLEPNGETEDENYFSDSASNSLGDSTFVPVRAGEATDSDDAAPRAVRFNKVAEVRVMSASQAGEALLARLSWSASVRASEYAQRRAAAAATRRHVRLALIFCVPWFVANYLYRLSLVNTTAGSATVYISASSAFVLTLGAIFAQMPNDRFSLNKCIAVLFTAAGLVSVGTSESHYNNWTGIISSLGAALCYALHLMMLRRELRKGESINAPLLTGLVGSACAGVTWILGGALGAAGIERAELPIAKLWTWLLIDALIGPLLYETLWLWGRSLTNSRTATAFLGLTIPLSLCVEAYRGYSGDIFKWVGAILAAIGWTMAAYGEWSQAHSVFSWLRTRVCPSQGFVLLRNGGDLDEQSEALMSTEEPT